MTSDFRTKYRVKVQIHAPKISLPKADLSQTLAILSHHMMINTVHRLIISEKHISK